MKAQWALCCDQASWNIGTDSDLNYSAIGFIVWSPVAPASIEFNRRLKLIGQKVPINFNWRFRDFTCKFNWWLNLIDDGATEFI